MKTIVVIVNLFILVLGKEFNVVNINQGPVRGYKVPGYNIYAYYGIPYATTPRGRDKFKAPLPPPVWSEPFEAVDEFIACPQHPERIENYSEDCLIANIYTPNTGQKKLPVVVLFHGGGFQVGYANQRTPVQLVNQRKNIVAVTFNYRLGPQGFLCLGTEGVPGNAGMKDQVALLRWVRDNIAQFGGNPEDVTIAGCSAGGAAVNLVALSKMANGLFKKVIGLSGSSTSVFNLQMDPTENARDYARKLSYNGEDNIQDIEEFFKDIPYERLFSITYNENKDIAVKFSPCIERDVIGTENFLNDTPINIINSKEYVKYPMIYGYSNMEGIYRLPKFDDWKVEMNEDFASFLPADLEFETEEQRKEIGNQIKQYYFGDSAISEDTVQGYVDYNSDAMFVVAVHRSITPQVRAGNHGIYLHVYSYTDNNTEPIMYSDNRGATHCAQSHVVHDIDEAQMFRKQIELSFTLREVWLNFIETGNPTPVDKITSVPHWSPVGEDRSPCMLFGSTIEVTGPYEKHRQDFWDDIYDRFQRMPIAPYDF